MSCSIRSTGPDGVWIEVDGLLAFRTWDWIIELDLAVTS